MPEHVELVGPVVHETARNDERTKSVHCRQVVAGHECDDEIAMSERRGVRRQKQAAMRLAREGVEGTLDVAVVFDGAGHKLKRQ